MFTCVAYYVCGMPLSLVFGFKMEMGVKGFWMGFMIALIALDIFVAYLVIWANWAPQALIAAEKQIEEEEEDDGFRKSQTVSGNEETHRMTTADETYRPE